MSLTEFVTIGIITGLIAATLIAVLLGYGRKIGSLGKILGWGIAFALIAAPLLVFVYGTGGLQKADRGAPAAEQAPSPESTPGAEPAAPESSEAEPEVVRKAAKEEAVEPPPEPSAPRESAETSGAAPEAEKTLEYSIESLEAAPASDAAVADKVNEKFDVVEVLFGTDRNQEEGDQRISFGSGRSGELKLGQAQVTIPKLAHERGVVERPWEFTVIGITIYREKESPEKHFTVQKLGILSEADFISAVKAKLATSKTYKGQAVVFVHGYNNDFDSALYRTAQMAYDLGFDGAPLLYSWPSAAGYSTYEYDQQSARQSVVHLRRFIELVTEQTGAEKIHLVAHSMGNDALLEALRELRFKFGPGYDHKINQIVLAAPDVDRNVFENLARQIEGVGKGITLYASGSDKALIASKAYAGGVARAGEVPEGGPVILSGIDTIDVTATNQDFLGLNHNTFAEKSQLLKDIKQILLTGVRPPLTRTPELVQIESDRGIYWKFPEATPD